jgi:hypothetical protein
MQIGAEIFADAGNTQASLTIPNPETSFKWRLLVRSIIVSGQCPCSLIH